MRLNRYLSKAGISSRRAADLLISQGRVRVNGEIVTALGTIIDEDKDDIVFDGKPARLRDNFVYLALNKPVGCLVTSRDQFGRPKAVDLIGKYGKIARPVGRLDFDSSGLLLFTDDGELAFRLSHPRYNIDKKYLVKCEGHISDESIEKLTGGMELDDGRTSPAVIEMISSKQSFSRFFITIHEGKKRQIRRMCLAVGHKVLDLTRVRYGNIDLDDLESGTYRILDDDEIEGLKKLVSYE